MPAPRAPFEVLADMLQAAPSLLGFSKVVSGKNRLTEAHPIPHIVIFPVEGGYSTADDIIASLVDVDLKMVAHLWASNDAEVWDLRRRFIQALRAQAVGRFADPVNATEAEQGAFYTLVAESWDTSPDTAQQGQELEVTFAIRESAAEVIQLADGGPILATSFAPAVPVGTDYASLVLAMRSAFSISPRNYWTLDYGTKCTTGSAGCVDRGSAGQSLVNLATPIDQQSFVPSSLTGACRIAAADTGFLSVTSVGSITSTPFSVETWLTAYTQVAPLTGMVGFNQFSIGLDAAGHFLLWGGIGPSAIVTSSRIYAPGARHYVVARYNTSGTLWDLWVDGTLAGSAVHSAPAISGGGFYVQSDGCDVAFEHPMLTLGLLSQAQQIATTALADLF